LIYFILVRESKSKNYFPSSSISVPITSEASLSSSPSTSSTNTTGNSSSSSSSASFFPSAQKKTAKDNSRLQKTPSVSIDIPTISSDLSPPPPPTATVVGKRGASFLCRKSISKTSDCVPNSSLEGEEENLPVIKEEMSSFWFIDADSRNAYLKWKEELLLRKKRKIDIDEEKSLG
jgi:hypothetical protein